MSLVLVLFQFLVGLNLIVWFNYIGLTFYLLIASKTKLRIAGYLFLILVMSFPLILGISFYRSWEFIEQKKYLFAFVFTGIPLIFISTKYLIVKKDRNIKEAYKLFKKLG